MRTRAIDPDWKPVSASMTLWEELEVIEARVLLSDYEYIFIHLFNFCAKQSQMCACVYIYVTCHTRVTKQTHYHNIC